MYEEKKKLKSTDKCAVAKSACARLGRRVVPLQGQPGRVRVPEGALALWWGGSSSGA